MNPQLSKEEMRNARLRALGLEKSNPSDSKSTATTYVGPAEKKQAYSNTAKSISAAELTKLQSIIYKGGGATEDDMIRWYEEGFQFCSNPSFGLKQGNGGPCGILAAVQAEMIRLLLFQDSSATEVEKLPSPSQDVVEELLAQSLSLILRKASDGMPINVVELSDDCKLKIMSEWKPEDLTVICYQSQEDVKLELKRKLDQLRGRCGCISFLISLILSRGMEVVVSDMDDPNNRLLGQFGHCNQDLINLLLTGKATSNVMDGEMQLGGVETGMEEIPLRIRGVQARTNIGYLTHLESLRYCQVGNYYKVPEYPVWVIGSSSHFSVLFCLTKKINVESMSEKLQSTLQRCFKTVDRDECGFIPAAQLKEVLEQINIHNDFADNPILVILKDETQMARLRGHMQIDGEIILWSSFWESASRLMSGESLDTIISCNTNVIDLTGNSSALPTGRQRSDSEMARELQAELDGTSLTPAQSSVSFEETRIRSDSEVARELQAQWDSEGANFDSFNTTQFPSVSNEGLNRSTDMVVSNSQGTSPVPFSSPVTISAKVTSFQQNAISLRKNVHRSDSIAGEDAESFFAFHFNGLESAVRSAKLTQFKIFIRSSVDAVGQSIAFEGGEHGGGGSFICPIEEVLRTRWPGCRCDWMGQSPPSID